MSKKIWDKMLGIVGLDVVEEEEMEDQIEENSYNSRQTGEYDNDNRNVKKKKGAVVSLHTQRQVKVVVYEPKSFDEAQSIANHLKNHRPVLLNLEATDKEIAIKIVDFISGATYALDGTVKKVGSGIFLFAPDNVDVSDETPGQMKDKGVFSWI